MEIKAEEIREWSDAQIEDRLKELVEETFKLRFNSAIMQLDDPNMPRKVRREIARLRTVKREREIRSKARELAARKQELAERERKRVERERAVKKPGLIAASDHRSP